MAFAGVQPAVASVVQYVGDNKAPVDVAVTRPRGCRTSLRMQAINLLIEQACPPAAAKPRQYQRRVVVVVAGVYEQFSIMNACVGDWRAGAVSWQSRDGHTYKTASSPDRCTTLVAYTVVVAYIVLWRTSSVGGLLISRVDFERVGGFTRDSATNAQCDFASGSSGVAKGGVAVGAIAPHRTGQRQKYCWISSSCC